MRKDSAGKRAGRPRRKGFRNKVDSIPFGQASKVSLPEGRQVKVPRLAIVRCSQENLREKFAKNKIVGSRIVKKASGYYYQLTIRAQHEQDLLDTTEAVGCDPGFKTVLTLSNGVKYENPQELKRSEVIMAQCQRGNNKKKTARLHEKIKNRRKDRNHKISHDIVKNYKEIYISKDNIKGMQILFGKSIAQAGLGQLASFIAAKSQSCGRQFKEVSAQYTTQTCHSCWTRSGPSGLKGCGVRNWECGCKAQHDRDINAARVILILGQGMTSGGNENSQKDSRVMAGLKLSQKSDKPFEKIVQSA